MNFNDLHPEQKGAIDFILNNEIGCIAPECGSGKTVIGLTALLGVKKIDGSDRVMLVASTSMGIKETWATEHLKWDHLKHLKVLVLTGDTKTRESRLSRAFDSCLESPDVVCISYNNLPWLAEYYKKNKQSPPFWYIFADEGSCLKGHNSKWREALGNLSKNAHYRIISTATPAPHDAADYWGLCMYLDGAECLDAPTITRFRELYCRAIPLPNRVGQRYELRKGASEEIKKRVSHLFYTFNVVKEVSVEVVNVWEDLSEKSLKLYQKLEREQCLNSIITTETGQLDMEESLDAMSLANKLAQMANGFVYADKKLRVSEKTLEKMTEKGLYIILKQKGRAALGVFDDRIMLFRKLIESIHRKHGAVPLAVAYLFKHDLDVLQAALPDGVPDTEPNVVERWNRGEIKYLFLQYARSSKALNLQAGGNILVVYSPTWNWEHDYQIVRRLARQGQTKDRVWVYRLWLRKTVDEQKFEVLEERGEGHRSFQKLIAKKARAM